MQRENSASARRVLGVVGRSGSGKTTLLEYLVARLAEQGRKVNIVKHSHHDIELEPPSKDSARLRRAGAAEVMIASPFRFAVIRELRGAEEPGMEEQLSRLSPADLTLIEGFKTWPMPKLEVFRRSVGQTPLYLGDDSIVAVASDEGRPAELPATVAWLDLNHPEQVLDWLSARLNNF
ncbi:molybdopterin-guanine dinucleotide biosynthesis protein B [Massilia sp. BJB1822]|uniref:molybdopterin-guanine dinucleotide biosynthesis protein B n=1 Tax=Massilia sp. BJB1822 TaxID=2744470 RepID=UPI001593CFFA|nr:molybdopterin-guanine dinucleotide biosynthesis protein B [Massilia sp. BJB1822]NVE00427.1 molybdopterin-guanine dinucleotide biosynthesis protein B [Massilia sp. BJB1822]